MNDTSSNQSALCIHPSPITDEQVIYKFEIDWWLQGLGSIVVGCTGLIFNLITIIIVLRSELAAWFFNWLLMCLSMFDNIFLAVGIYEGIRNHFAEDSSTLSYQFVVFLYPLRNVAMCGSIYLTLLLALERYNALAAPPELNQPTMVSRSKPPFKNHILKYWKRLLKNICPVLILSIALYFPKFFEQNLVPEKHCSANSTIVESNCTYKYIVHFSELRENEFYTLWSLNIQIFVTILIPIVCLIYLNVNVFLRLRRHKKMMTGLDTSIPTMTSDTTVHANNREAAVVTLNQKRRIDKRDKNVIQQTMMLFVIVILFIISHTLRVILNIEELVNLGNVKEAKEEGCMWLQYWSVVLVPISHFLHLVNSSINLIVYCFLNTLFRKAVKTETLGLVSFFKSLF